MKPQTGRDSRITRGFSVSTFTAAVSGLLLVAASPARAQFRELVDRIPRTANAVVLLNMEKAKQSAFGKRQGWTANVETAFEAGIWRVPPQATRYVLATELDFSTMQPAWEVAVGDLAKPVTSDQIIKFRGGMPDSIEKLPAVVRTNNVYIVQFSPTRVGAMGPANRQAVVRWIREVQAKSPRELSPYLEKAAGYSDDAGTEIIMAIDLDGVLQWERVAKYAAGKEKLIIEGNSDVKTVTNLVAGIQGIRVGIRIGDAPSGRLTVDFAKDVKLPAPLAKRLLLTVLADNGMRISDFDEWNVTVKENTLSLDGTLSQSGLRLLLSIIDSPASSESGSASDAAAPSANSPSVVLAASRDHYKAVQSLLKDLKESMKDLKSLSHSMVFFDKYAKKIENLPILSVDEELLAYGAWVARQVRDCAGAVRTMGIRGGAREAQTFGTLGPTSVAAFGAGAYGAYGGYGGAWGVRYTYDPLSDVKGTEAARRVVRSEEKAIMASDVHTIRDQLFQASADIRRKMTQKYQVEF